LHHRLWVLHRYQLRDRLHHQPLDRRLNQPKRLLRHLQWSQRLLQLWSPRLDQQ